MSEIQSIIFKKQYWTPNRAKQWLIFNGFKAEKIDETEKYYRFRQQSPDKFEDFRMINLKPSVKAVIGFF